MVNSFYVLEFNTACEIVGLPAPENFQMTREEEIENEYFPENFMARHVADEDGDPLGKKISYPEVFKEHRAMCTEKEQKPFVDKILKAALEPPLSAKLPRYHFLTGRGGTGKTFVYNVSFFKIFFSIFLIC